ncbi:unnamed protein product [Effrenium voratum]|nr:unnamed protein product [Effrenium voratum]
MTARILDEAMAEVGGKHWRCDMLPNPRRLLNIDDQSLGLKAFLDGACRKLGGVKSVAVLFDAYLGIPEFGGLAGVLDAVAQQRFDALPDPLKVPGNSLPPDAKMDIIINNLQDGRLDVLKVIYFQSPLPTRLASGYTAGQPFTPLFRNGPWAVKKAIQSLMDKMKGTQVRWWVVTKQQSQPLQRSASSSWSTTDESLLAGIEYINNHTPDCDSKNEQTFWILSNTREDADTPISGWPEAKVRMMAQNKSRGVSGAQPQHEFPLTTWSLKPILSESILPLVYPLLTSFGVFMLGWPGVGKTPLMLVMAMAIGRHHAQKLGLSAPAGWRRARSLDNFRHRFPQIQECLFLDDPSRDRLDISDLKSFMTVEEDQTCSGRYNDVKLIKNGMRGYASNDLDDADEPVKDGAVDITPDEFFKLLRKSFPGDRRSDVLAVLKRSVVWVFGKYALYLRLPTQSPSGVIHRITWEAVHTDVLSERDKPLYGKYKQGECEYGATYEEDVSKEQGVINQGMDRLREFDRPEQYIDFCNAEISSKLLLARSLPVAPGMLQLPDSPEDDLDTTFSAHRDEKGVAVFPKPLDVGSQRKNSRFKSPFKIPTKRHRSKAPASMPEDLPQPNSAGAGEGHDATAVDEYQADEEEAARLHGDEYKKVKYVRVSRDVPAAGVRGDRASWKRTLKEILSASDKKIIQKLQQEVEYKAAIINGKSILWEQWSGILARGKPSTLVLSRLNPALTVKRAPGPGAIRKIDWTPLAERHLKNTRVMLHTDAAKSYKAKISGVYHDAVIHCKKLVTQRNGKRVWKAPQYVKVVNHTMRDGTKLKVKAGTQHIDRAWRFIKDRLKRNQKVRAGTRQLRAQIRSAQYEYWLRGQDLWLKTGELIRQAMAAFVQK